MLQGISEKGNPTATETLTGNEGDISLTNRGKKTSNTRQRNKLVYIKN